MEPETVPSAIVNDVYLKYDELYPKENLPNPKNVIKVTNEAKSREEGKGRRATLPTEINFDIEGLLRGLPDKFFR